MKQLCERCDKSLKAEEHEAFICSFECTFCRECTQHDLKFNCPNCGGVLVQRPNRVKKD
ncbi:DUF1272 domain-containing protein [Marinicella litoralis]|nr:DUF1272 domain-containing protein [Marinicella litoralis]